MKSWLKVIFLTAFLAGVAGSRSTAQGYLHVSGKRIVDGAGNEVLLRGMGLGGWLVPEGYMLGTSSFADSPTGLRTVVTNLVGQANADEFFRLYRKYYVARADIDSLARWGFNSVRLPMHYDLLTPKNSPGVYSEAGFALIDSLLSWCEVNRLYLILDLHCAPGGQNSGNISDYIPGEPSLWESAEKRTRTVDLWKKIAERYADRTWIGGYDLLNETAWDLGTGNVPLRTLLVQITTAIRSVDNNHVVFAEGNWYATDFSGLTPGWDANMVYSFHKYWNVNDAGAIAGYLNLRNTTNLPLWLGEAGENSNQWFCDCVALMEANGIGWSWWPHKKIESVAGPLSAKRTPEFANLIRYWNGQIPAPTVPDAVAALNGQAANLSIEKCRYSPDVIDALMRQPSSSARLPYAANAIPGTVHGVNYDIGRQGIAYRDADYQNTAGNGGPAYNNGWLYRNDGVDIEACSDFLSNGYDVGWTSAGDFLTYTVRVNQPGSYNMQFRVAANQPGGSILLRWDQAVMMPVVNIPSTGGWQAWQSLNLGQVELTAGVHDLRLDVVTSGFNFNAFKFTLLTSAGDEPVPRRFALYANYPNPFNPSTSVSYELPAREEVTVKVYDLLGREVGTLVNGVQPAGIHTAVWDASGISSGVYFCQLTGAGRMARIKMVLQR
jgi:hypothetical protein